MSHPYGDNDRSAAPPPSGDGDSDETQIVRPPVGGYPKAPSSGPTPSVDGPAYGGSATPADGGSADPRYRTSGERGERLDPFSAPMPTIAAPPVGAPIGSGSTSGSSRETGGWAPAYSDQPYRDQPIYPAQPAVTSVYPQVDPGYAPAGYPPAYAPAVVVPPPAAAALPTETSSRVVPALICALLGVILTAGGLFLGVKYGIGTAGTVGPQTPAIKNAVLVSVGALLLLGAVVLNGWSPWATIIPGIGLTGLGGWTLFNAQGADTVSNWTKSVLTVEQLKTWNISGFTLILGLVLLSASVAAMLSRATGKRDGAILGRRQA